MTDADLLMAARDALESLEPARCAEVLAAINQRLAAPETPVLIIDFNDDGQPANIHLAHEIQLSPTHRVVVKK